MSTNKDSLTSAGIVVLVASGLSAIWGYFYVQNHPFEGMATMLSGQTSTYSIASFAMVGGLLGFLLGVGLLIAGLSRSR